jgi:hypothetical protein
MRCCLLLFSRSFSLSSFCFFFCCTGRDKAECFLSKVDNGDFALFTVAQSDARLAIANLTMLLTNHSSTAGYVCSMETNDAVYITLLACRLAMATGVAIANGPSAIFGQSFRVDNSRACFRLESCASYNVTFAGPPSLPGISTGILCGSLYEMTVVGCSFANLRNTGGGDSCLCTCFNVNTADFMVTHCLFVGCYSATSIGVGALVIRSWGMIHSCIFWNNTAANGHSGCLQLLSSRAYHGSVDVVNTSYVDCSSFAGG